MLTVAKATDARYYTSHAGVAAGMESYYLDAVTEGEPPGRWHGRAAGVLGLSGEVDAQDMQTLFGQFTRPDTGEPVGFRPAQRRTVEERLSQALAAEPETLPERVEELRRQIERTHRKTVIGWDATFSVPKSVSAAHTAARRGELAAARSGDLSRAAEYLQVRVGIESAIREANAAGLEVVEDLVRSRAGGGPGAQTRWVKGQTVIASFFQHTNRSIDPHLHVHNVILNRMLCEDGVWRAVDGKDLLAQRFTASAVADRVLFESLARLGLESKERPDGLGRELAIVPAEVVEHFSSRRVQMTRAVEPLVEQFTVQTGREPTEAELCRLKTLAARSSRRAKSHEGESVEEMVSRWYATLATEQGQCMDALGARVLSVVRDHAEPGEDEDVEGLEVGPGVLFSPSAVVAEAVAACAERSAVWGRANLVSEIELRLPILGLEPGQVRGLLEGLADLAISSGAAVQVTGDPQDIGGPVAGADVAEGIEAGWAAPSQVRFAAAETLAAEAAVRRATQARSGHAVPRDQVAAWLDEYAPTIGVDQRAAVEGIAGTDAAVSVLVGPAGTGKSYTAGALASCWEDLTGGGRVVGLAVSQAATMVLADDGIRAASNLARWLDAQDRVEAGHARPGDEAWVLGGRDVVLVDEASMVPTPVLERVRARVQAAGARMVLAGDPRQLGAVGAGGALDLLEGHAPAWHLSDVRRFAVPWERSASLRVRDGDPQALAEYDRHGRLLGYDSPADAEAAAARAAVADRLDGHATLVVAPSNTAAARISALVREDLIRVGVVDATGDECSLGRDQNTAGPGDLIVCRRNHTTLGVTNRVQYRVTDTAPDGSLTVTPLDYGPTVRLPAQYVADHVQLGYASTVHAAQGLTVDAAHLVTGTTGTSPSTLYVGLTRGRTRNTCHVALDTTPGHTATVPGRAGGTTHLTDTAPRATALSVLEDALATQATDSGPGVSASATVTAHTDTTHRTGARHLLGRIEAITRDACRVRLETHLDALTAPDDTQPTPERPLTARDRARLAADQGTEYLSRVLRAAEHDGHDPRTVLTRALADPRGLDTAESPAQVLTHRLTTTLDTHPENTTHTHTDEAARIPAGIHATAADTLTRLHQALAERRATLGEQAATDAPDWAVLALGPVPPIEDPADRADWQNRAGLVAAHREAVAWDDPDRALPAMPGRPLTERRADYTSAWHALGRPEPELADADLTEGQIRVRIRAWKREQDWAPPYAADALRAAEEAAETARQAAALADAEHRPEDAERHRAEAALKAAAAEHLTILDARRTTWAASTAPTRATAEAATTEAERRGLDLDHEPDRTTATTWLHPDGPTTTDTTHHAADDAHRTITDADLPDIDPTDYEWATRETGPDPASPEIPPDHTPTDTAPPTAKTVIPLDATVLELDALLAGTGHVTTRDADRTSQDDAHTRTRTEQQAITAAEAARRRREATDAEAAARTAAAGARSGDGSVLYG